MRPPKAACDLLRRRCHGAPVLRLRSGPAVGIVLVVELTGAYALTLPMLAACLASGLVAEWLGGRPIDAQMLERTLKQAGVVPPAEVQPEAGLTADAGLRRSKGA
jgi:hypothetical protein